jgi:transposase
MRTPATRKKYSRPASRYQGDATNEEWRVIEPLLPRPKTRGRRWGWPPREIVNAIFYVMRSGYPWRLLPADFPPWSTVYRWFVTWRDACVFEKINRALVMIDLERVGFEASPTAALIDSQSVKTTEAGGPRGFDAGKKVNASKRHALVDTDGRALLLEPHPASVQDRDGRRQVLRASRALHPFIARVTSRLPDWNEPR